MEFVQEPYRITTDIDSFDVLGMYRYLSEESYWATGLTFEKFDRAVKNSLCFGLFKENKQIGLARVISDYATFAYLKDVFVLTEYQGTGLGKWLMDCIFQYPGLNEVDRWHLLTLDAHRLYKQFGFTPLDYPRFHMERVSTRHKGQGEDS
ncbi:MAG TPA: GNAT family N-acetyltransferase [Cytophagales bacterium]|nr:GNAT family N-acetyltransferase [Cytophagales bacterium]HAA20916.1 GNAT family N-acetyltransferase [Cytophagales bacterium]HAP60600.1 GNAT family N-acetyltransferase [Cytophagales bacterium]